MATVHQYFETDFAHMAKVKVSIGGAPESSNESFDIFLYLDFAASTAFLSIFVPGERRSLLDFVSILRKLEYGKTQLHFDKTIYLPSARSFPGALQIGNVNPLEIKARFFGEADWMSMSDVQSSRRVFLYSETQLEPEEIVSLKNEARSLGHDLQFRSEIYAVARSNQEKPLAFISYDSRDRDEVARIIAIGLGRMMCPVWYDEFSLKVGDNLRTRIETGIKECKRCILVLSRNFFSNTGWTKKEFDSIFTRELLEGGGLVLPVWFGVTKNEVYEYSPSLLLAKGVDWQLGEDEVCRQLNLAITADE